VDAQQALHDIASAKLDAGHIEPESPHSCFRLELHPLPAQGVANVCRPHDSSPAHPETGSPPPPDAPTPSYLQPQNPDAQKSATRIDYLTKRPDFVALALKYPHFSKFVQSNGKVDFRSWHASHALTQVLLQDGFGILDWNIPEGHLVPALPNRMNYVLWVSDILSLSCTGVCSTRWPLLHISVMLCAWRWLLAGSL
jgi:hypothetical protein